MEKNLDRGTRRVKRCGHGEILMYPAATGDRFYAYIGKGATRTKLGTYTDVGLAEHAINAYMTAKAEVTALDYPTIVEEWVSDLEDAFHEAVRREWFGAAWDPIAASAVRLGFGGDLTLDQVARLYGVSRQRIQQVEVTGGVKYAKVLDEYRDHIVKCRESPMAIIEGGVW